ncbi:MAG TPA: SIMPL domain-containing protein [Candidatus Dormibacteraeota bacterium]|jgi:hypothetical protein|nr:SIMPL domain-containing protein [Candidatus Dormibacteraeota bacterium]
MVPVKLPFASRLLLVGLVTLGLLMVSAIVARWSAAPARAAVLPVQSPPLGTGAAITVTGTGTIDLTPDVARVTVSVQTTASTATQAEADNATAADKVRALVARAGVSATDIKTLSLQVWPRYDYRTGQSVLNGFEANHTFEFTIHDLARIGAVIDAAVAGGATTVQGISYDTNDHTAASAQALARAVKDAQVKARAMADAAGIRLGSVVSITDLQNAPYPFPILRAAAAPSVGGATQVSPPDVQLTVSVQVGWAIG